MSASTLFHNGAVVTLAEAGVLDPGWVRTEGDRIAEVGAGVPDRHSRTAAERTVDLAGGALMPGMVNAHTHLFQTLFRGQADDKPLLDWLRECIWPAAVHLDADSAYVAARLGLVENLRGGATSVIDHQYIHVDETIDEAVAQAASDSGVRFLLARGWADRNYEPRLMEDVDTVLERTEAVRARWHGADGGRLSVGLAPLIPWGCSDEGMRRTVEWTRSWDAPTHIHCAETAGEVELSLAERSRRHVTWMDDLGVLGPDSQLAHSVWVDEDELDLIAARGALVVHCPVSNMYLASGVAPVPAMRARGITVALASDGPGSNNRQDMFEAMKAAVLLHKVDTLDAMVLQPEDVLVMACHGGAVAMGRPEDLGSIEPGRLADLVAVDLESPLVAPVHRVASALVFNVGPRDVRTVMVAGRVLVDGGTVVGLDEQDLVGRAREAAGVVFERAGVATRLVERRGDRVTE